MRENYALRYLQKLVSWDEARLASEVGWLRRAAKYKYDNYQDFYAGERFVSSLIRWLHQFEAPDRDYAYSLLREKVIFLSAPEIQHLVKRTVPAHFHNVWVERLAKQFGVPKYALWSVPESRAAYGKLVRRSLFIGLSDGARIDAFRRANVGVVGNEQVVANYELSDSKLKGMLEDLRSAEESADAAFEVVFLIDDFLGSGTTLCRKSKEKWKGKIAKFGDVIKGVSIFAEDFDLVAHHYVATEFGLRKAEQSLADFATETSDKSLRGKSVKLTADLKLADSRRFPLGCDGELDEFLEKYYDPGIMTKSLWEGGCHVQNGFANCGLVIVLEHNTPNNSLALLWADSPKKGDRHEMKALFRRRQRHD